MRRSPMPKRTCNPVFVSFLLLILEIITLLLEFPSSLRLGKPISRQKLCSCPFLFLCYLNKNVIKNNITRSVIHIIVCLLKIK